MDKTVIIGGGFSAFIAKILCKNETIIVTPKEFKPNETKFTSGFIRRKGLECNKAASPKTFSYGTIKYKLSKKIMLHDRLILGGNSGIWGGLVDTTRIPNWYLKKLTRQNLILQKLSFANTNSISNKGKIKQLLNANHQIFNAHEIISPYYDGILEKIFFYQKKIKLQIIYKNKKQKIQKKVISTDRVILCIGVVQTIDLLYRSNLIKDNDRITLTEFEHKLSYRITQKPLKFLCDIKATIIRYNLFGAIAHFLGHQKNFSLNNLLQLIPIFIDQYFITKKNTLHMIVSHKTATNNYLENQFGNSIHYNNMKINEENINNFLKKINKNICGLGMAFVTQKIPGPISNDIILDSIKKLIRK